MRFVAAFNAEQKTARAAYTFDAGPNCCVYIEEQNVRAFLDAFCSNFSFKRLDSIETNSFMRLCASATTTSTLPLEQIIVSK